MVDCLLPIDEVKWIICLKFIEYFSCVQFWFMNWNFRNVQIQLWHHFFFIHSSFFSRQDIHFSWWCQSFNATDIMMDGLRMHCLIDSKRFVFMKSNNNNKKWFNISAQRTPTTNVKYTFFVENSDVAKVFFFRVLFLCFSCSMWFQRKNLT